MTHRFVNARLIGLGLLGCLFSTAVLANPITFVSVAAGDQSDDATSSGPLSLSVRGNGLEDQGTASATGHADFGTLGVVGAGRAVPGPAFPTVVASALARFDDTLLIGGVDGELVSVTLSLTLNGSCTWTDGATGGFPDASCLGEGSLAGPGLLGIGVSESHPSGSITFDWGGNTLLPIAAELDAHGSAWNGSFNAAFGDTLHVYAFTTTPGVVIASASGHDYSPPTSTVPEPGTALLLATGLAAAARRRIRRRAVLSILGIGLLVLGAPRIASAHAGDNDPNHEHACIGNLSKVVRIVGVGGACITSPPLVAETPAHWSVQGPPGVPGAPGINGIDGASVTFVGYFAGNQNGCPNGGAIFAVRSVTAYVCNGLNVINGTGGTRADGPCFDSTNRYVDCGNGTVTDTVTGLIWLKQWNCLPPSTWAAANQTATALKDLDCGLTDNSSPGDWRLPTKDEWSATMARAVALGCVSPSLTDDAGTACYGTGVASSFAGVASGAMWSSTAYETNPGFVWTFSIGDGSSFAFGPKTYLFPMWPVRGGGR